MLSRNLHFATVRQLPQHTLSIALGVVLTAILPQAASAQEQTEAADLNTVQVTGSRIKRAQVEGPSPVTVITAQQMENEGHASVFEALQTLVMAGGEVETELSGGFSPNASPLNLRGLGPGRSLLLIDGRRAADYPFPYNGRSNFQNFGNIPAAAVERIEVLAGGASAIYGADAVSGVVNVVMKRNYDGDVVKLRGSTSTSGGRDRLDAQWTGGKTGDNWGVTYAFQYYEQDILYGFERGFWDLHSNPNPNAMLGIQPDYGLRIRLGGNQASRPLVNFDPGTCARWGGEFVDWGFRRVNNDTIQNLGDACGTWNNVRYEHLSKGTHDLAGYVFGTWDFNDDVQGWASLQSWRSRAESISGFETITGPHTNGVGRRADFWDRQFATTIAPYRRLTPAEVGGLKQWNQHYRELSLDLAAGLRGRLGQRFDWDLTLSRATYDFERNRRRLVGDLVNAFFFGPELGTRSNGTPIHELNLERWLRPLTPAEYDSLSTIAHYEAKSWVNTASFVLSGSLMELPAGDLSMAVIAEASRQGYALDSEPRIQPGVVELYNLTGTNGGGKRNRYALGVEFSIPLLPTLNASLAGRFDQYDDITDLNDAKTWNAGLEWRPLERLLIRGSYATSFKAPDLHWVFSEGSGSFGNTTDLWRCIAAGANPDCTGYSYSMFTLTQGDPNLREEAGKSWSAGVVWDIIDQLSLTVDYWNIELDGAIQRLTTAGLIIDEARCRTGLNSDGSTSGDAFDSAYCQEVYARVIRTPEDGQAIGRVSEVRSSPINQSWRRVAGIDAGLTWRLATQRLGSYTFRSNWSHTLASERQVFASDPVNKEWRDARTNRDFRSRLRAGMDWRGGQWKASVFATRYGTLPQRNGPGRTGVHLVWNANVGRQIGQQTEVRLYVNNLFNNIHPHDPTNTTFPYFYDAYSPVGREVAAQVEYRFD